MSIPLVDTNILVRLITRDDERLAKKAKKLIEDSIHFVPQVIWTETIFVLTSFYKYSRKDLNKIRELLKTEYFEIEAEELFDEAIFLFQKHKKLSFPDAYLLAKGRLEEREISTFDADLRRISQSV